MDLSEFIQAVQVNDGRVLMPSGNKYVMRHGEDPASYYMRVQGAEDAWKAKQKATAPSKDAGGEDAGGERKGDDGGDDRRGEPRAQASPPPAQTSLADTIESQVVALRRSSAALTEQIARATDQLRRDKEDLKNVERELKLAKKFLRTLSPEVRESSSSGVPSEEGKESDGGS